MLDWDWFQFNLNQPVCFSGWFEKLVATSLCMSPLCTTKCNPPPPCWLCKKASTNIQTWLPICETIKKVGRVCLCIFTRWIKVFQVWKVYCRPQRGRRLIMSHRDDKRIAHFRWVLPAEKDASRSSAVPSCPNNTAAPFINTRVLLTAASSWEPCFSMWGRDAVCRSAFTACRWCGMCKKI